MHPIIAAFVEQDAQGHVGLSQFQLMQANAVSFALLLYPYWQCLDRIINTLLSLNSIILADVLPLFQWTPPNKWKSFVIVRAVA